ncbi:MAG: polyisoprenyl-phosphate glycosyltransferase [Verrucomicrobiota bacterium]|jgi:glycosyltransferase involved in cell wall biosynthesis
MKLEESGLAGPEAQASAHGSPLISVIIPLYNEGANLHAFLADVRAALDKTGCPFELVLIDDGSPDDTWKVVSDEAGTLPAIRAVRLSRNFGKELALCAGLERARGDVMVLMDGDGQHPPALLPDMLRLWQTTGADIVEAVKIKRGPESLSGKLGALLFYIILNKLSGFDLKGASDFKLMNRKAINAWLGLQERNVFFRGMTAWLGFTTVRIPFEVVPRSSGKSSWSYLKRLRLAVTGLTAFSSFPLQLVTLAGAVFFVFAVLLGAQTLYLKLAGRAVSGFATVILLELIIGSSLMISLGIVGEYLARIYEEVKGRPRYVVSHSIERGINQSLAEPESAPSPTAEQG